MTCRQFAQRLNDLLDRRCNTLHEEQLLRHSRRCRSCRRLLAAHLEMLDGVSGLSSPTTNRWFAAGVSASVVADAIRRRRLRWWTSMGLATAAAVAVWAALPWRSHVDLRDGVAPPQVVATNARPAGEAVDDSADHDNFAADDSFDANNAEPRRQAPMTRKNVSLARPPGVDFAAVLNMLRELNSARPSASDASGDQIQPRSEWIAMVEPFANSTASTFRIVWDSFSRPRDNAADNAPRTTLPDRPSKP